jgi:hypothetical protein
MNMPTGITEHKLLREEIEEAIANDVFDAIDRMEEILSDWRYDKSSLELEEMLRLCTRFPRLATFVIEFCHDVMGGGEGFGLENCLYSPISLSCRQSLLCCLIESGSLGCLEMFLEQHKDRLKSPQYLLKIKPIHRAARYFCGRSGAIPLLLKYFPEEAIRVLPVIDDFYIGLPLFQLLKCPHGEVDMDTLRALFSATYPYGFPKKTIRAREKIGTHMLLLDIVLANSDTSESLVREYVIAQVNHHCQIETFDSREFRHEMCLDENNVSLLATFFEGQKKLKAIDLCFTDIAFQEEQLDWATALFRSLENLPSLHTLTLALKQSLEDGMYEEQDYFDDTLLALKASIARFSSLRDLRVTVPWKRDCTELALEAMRHPNLTKLLLKGVLVNPGHLFNALKNNNSLEKLVIEDWNWSYDALYGLVSTLWHNNTTLRDFHFHGTRFAVPSRTDCSQSDYKGYLRMIDGLVTLNRCERYKLKDPNVPLTKVVDLLVACGQRDDSVVTRLFYAVLREAPGKWSSTSHRLMRDEQTYETVSKQKTRRDTKRKLSQT